MTWLKEEVEIAANCQTYSHPSSQFTYALSIYMVVCEADKLMTSSSKPIEIEIDYKSILLVVAEVEECNDRRNDS